MLELKKPIVFFDLETTGVDIHNDRIVEITVIKLTVDGEKIAKTRRINPTIQIPKEASEIHGITNEDVAKEPTFKQVAKAFASFITGCDLAGYNSDFFDIPLLWKEFERAGIELDFSSFVCVDIYKLYAQLRPRKLADAYKDICGKELLGAHGSKVDTEATLDIFDAMVTDHYDGFEKIEEFSMNRSIDPFNKLAFNDKNEIVVNFGAHKDKTYLHVKNNVPGWHVWAVNNVESYKKACDIADRLIGG